MQVAQFLQNIIQQTGHDWSVFALRGTAYAPLFCTQLLDQLKKRDVAVATIDVVNTESAAVMAELTMSFLGESKIYWCGDLTELDAAQKKLYSSFFKTYAGPHKIMFFSDQPFDAGVSIELPVLVDQGLFKELFALFYPGVALSKEFLQAVCAAQPKMSLDGACMAMQYCTVISEDELKHNPHFFEKILVAERSRFTLSQYFFSKDQILFFRLWREIEPDFPPEFWLVFWSEQIWQASLFVTQAKEVGPLVARKGINRLPFSFMQRDWKRYQERELCAAHSFLYGVDYGMKNGYAKDGLELFLWRFVQGEFARK